MFGAFVDLLILWIWFCCLFCGLGTHLVLLVWCVCVCGLLVVLLVLGFGCCVGGACGVLLGGSDFGVLLFGS